MIIPIKSHADIKIMKEGGEILGKIMQELSRSAKVGVSTGDIDLLAEDLCKKNNVIPAFKGYMNFPSSVCTGLNATVVHGIPHPDEKLIDGDILSIDMGIIYKEFYLDHAVTVGIGSISRRASKLIKATRLSRDAGISMAIAGNTIGDIGNAMEEVAKKNGFSVVREMVGHGIGKNLHEEPEIPGYGNKGEGPILKGNMCLAIEAIINEGRAGINISKIDGWTTKTKDGMLSALFEHTVVVGEIMPVILTQA